MQNIDLHSHSRHSDGRLSPRELLQAAYQAGVTSLGLTDHDTTAGLPEAFATAKDLGVTLIPGVEISVTWNQRTIHVLGLRIDPDSEPLQQGLQALRDKREQRAVAIAEGLAKAGIDGALDWVQQRVDGGLISRTHFAEFLVENGHAKDVRAVFKRYLVKGKPGYVSVYWCDLADAVAWIRHAGGIAVIAHPARYKLTRSKLVSLLEAFIALGGQGLEVVSSSHNAQECQALGQLANRFGLLASCGSDFHSPNQAWAQLGNIPPLPAQCEPIWSQWSEICSA